MARPWPKPRRTRTSWPPANGLVFVHPYDDPAVMAGQGTLALEMLEDAPDLDVLVVPVGGGGMIAGCAVAAAAIKPGIEVIGVEVESLRLAAAGARGPAGHDRRRHHRRGHRRAPYRRELPFAGSGRMCGTCWWCRSGWWRTRSRCSPRGPSRSPRARGRPGSRRCSPIPRASPGAGSASRYAAAISTGGSSPTCCCAGCCAMGVCCG